MPKFLSAFDIKIIAVATMVIDHVGYLFFPNLVFLRMIGRLSLPLFAWLIANGSRHTNNINAYLNRLLVFAALSQAPYYFFKSQVNPTFMGANVLFTLFFGLLAIKGVKETGGNKRKILIIAVCSLTARLFGADYGATGVLSIAAFYLFFANAKYLVAAQTCIYFIPYLATVLPPFFISALPKIDISRFNEPLALLSLVFVFLYNQNPGPRLKYFFYFFYPLQFIAILALRQFLLLIF